jgi:hypothetical protein
MAGETYVKNKDVVTRKIGGDLFVIPIRSNVADMQKIFTLNPVGEFIWQEIDGQKSLDEIRKGVMDRFDVEEEEADSDIREFIATLLETDLIRG